MKRYISSIVMTPMKTSWARCIFSRTTKLTRMGG